jgi:hypothetical protein
MLLLIIIVGLIRHRVKRYKVTPRDILWLT